MNVLDYFAKNSDEMNYRVYYPDNYKDLPLLIYLHGAGERGTNLPHLERQAIPRMIKNGASIPAVVLCPQCPAVFVWDNVTAMLKRVIDEVVEKFGILKDRICITGSSMGGYGTWMMGLTYPSFFSGIAPIAGGGMSWRVRNLRTTPVYAVHGKLDTSVPIECSELMVDALNKLGYSVKFKVLENHGHNDGINYTYTDTDVIEWLLSQRKTDFSPIPDVCSEWF